MRLNDLDGKRVVIWGAGREAGAFIHAVRTLDVHVKLAVIDEHAEYGASIEGIEIEPVTQHALDEADFVMRSPGVSVYKPELQGRSVITATGLWFAEPHAPIIAVTGTKGKSTTSSLIAHILKGIGKDVRLAGNIGRSPLDLMGTPEPQFWVVELSSFQISDADAEPDVAVLTSLDSDHLDWHGDQQHYVDDKLRLFEKAHKTVVNVVDLGARAVLDRLHDVIEVDDSIDVAPSQLFGAHNAQLIRLALAAIQAAGVDVIANQVDIAAAIATFAPLPHRLEPVGEVDGVLYVNDSLSTNPIAATAAIRSFVGRPISLLLGGFDRGLSFKEFGKFVGSVPQLKVFTMPDNGEHIADSIVGDVPIVHTDGLEDAVKKAQVETPMGGVVLLAPAAASFGHFKDYVARGEAFREIVSKL